MTDPQYYNNANPHLLAFMSRRHQHVLEIGCGMGALGEAFKKEYNPQCIYRGVEYEEDAAEQAAKRLDSVLCGDVEAMSNADLGIEEGSLDCLIYGDVLEHLHDPWAELSRRSLLVKPRGAVLACIPNVGHWSMVTRLMMGDWDYADSGILDRTHLRFFTRKSIYQLFEGAGLKITRIKGITKEGNWSARFFDALDGPLRELGMDAQAFRDQAANLQYALKAIRVPPE